jgi:hypothetical protein
MKEFILTGLSLASVLSTLAQGTVIFNNRSGGTTHVYAPLAALFGDAPIYGNASNDSPPGPADYGNRALIGANGTGGQWGAATTLAVLLGAPGANAPESSLLPNAGSPSSFRTGTAAGAVASSTATFNNIPKDALVATFEMAVWDNNSGLYPTWTQASQAWQNGLIGAARSQRFMLNQIGGDVNVPQSLFNTQNGASGTGGLQSFNIWLIPEPTGLTFAITSGVLLALSRKQSRSASRPATT